MARKKFLEEDNRENQNGSNSNNNKPNSKNSSDVLNYNNNANFRSSKNKDDSFICVQKQLLSTGLTIREIPGDGNCLFRSLADQLEGHTRNHFNHRQNIVKFMIQNRADFEPFIENDIPFEKYVQSLSQPGSFAGNDAIAAFARLYNVTVVIHQLNTPAWLIHPNQNSPTNGRQVHIAYHNGDHYNSVRKLGDDSENPTDIRLDPELCSGNSSSFNNKSGKKSPNHTGSSNNNVNKIPGVTSSTTMSNYTKDCDLLSYDPMLYEGRDEDYWVKDTSDLERLVQEVMQQTNYHDPNFVRETLIDFNFDISSTINFIIHMSEFVCHTHTNEQQESNSQLSLASETNNKDFESDNKGAEGKIIQSENETIGENINSGDEGANSQDSFDSIESESVDNSLLTSHEKIQNKSNKISAKQRKELKKRERKLNKFQQKRTDKENIENQENKVVVKNINVLDV